MVATRRGLILLAGKSPAAARLPAVISVFALIKLVGGLAFVLFISLNFNAGVVASPHLIFYYLLPAQS